MRFIGKAVQELSVMKTKLEAEKELLQNDSPEIKLTIIRPPLVFGPGVKANMYNLIKGKEYNSTSLNSTVKSF